MTEPAKKSLLLVEDEALIALATRASLERYGYSVSTASSGEAAIEAARSGAPLDLVLMDIDLGPGMDGTEAAAVILAEHELPVVFLSSHAKPEVVANTEKITSYGYVVKNSSITVLDASIKMALKLFDAHRRIVESEERFQDLFENMNDAFALHEVIFDDTGTAVDYRFVEANSEFAKRVGIERGQLIGRTARELFPATEQSWIDAFARVATTGVAEQFTDYSTELNRHFETRLYSPRPGFCAGLFSDITEQKLLEEAYRAGEERRRKLVDHTNDAIIVHTLTPEGFPGPNVEVNAQASRMLGYTREELLKLSAGDVVPESAAGSIPEHVAELLANGRATFETENRRRDGTIIPVEVSAYVYSEDGQKYVVSIVRDISARKTAEEALRMSDAQFRTLFENAPDAVFIADVETGTILSANSAGCAMTGRTIDLLVGMHHNELHPQRIQDRTADDFSRHTRERAVSAALASIESEVVRRDGTTVPVEVKASHVVYQGRPCLMGIFRDVRDRKEAERKISALVAEKETLLKEVQHRIKNVMRTMAAMLVLQTDSAHDPSSVASLRDAAPRFQSIELLYDQLYRDESHGRASLKPFLTRLVEGVVGFFGGGDGLKLETSIADLNLPEKTLSTVGLIVNELTTNAMKYAFNGRPGGTLSVRGEAYDRHLVITVQDDGPGLPPGFDIHRSVGFGLTMVHAFVEQLGGTVQFETRNGTAVAVTFPIEGFTPAGEAPAGEVSA